jgi:hypothetical protein
MMPPIDVTPSTKKIHLRTIAPNIEPSNANAHF